MVDGQDDLYRAVPIVSSLFDRGGHAELSIELFRQRPVGHQAWKTPGTAKLIGALEWVAAGYDVQTSFYPPGNAREHLEGLKIRTVLAEWATHWPRGQWNHAWSAWRILTIHLLREHFWWLTALLEMSQVNVIPPKTSHDVRVATAPRLVGRASASENLITYKLDRS